MSRNVKVWQHQCVACKKYIATAYDRYFPCRCCGGTAWITSEVRPLTVVPIYDAHQKRITHWRMPTRASPPGDTLANEATEA